MILKEFISSLVMSGWSVWWLLLGCMVSSFSLGENSYVSLYKP